MTAEESNFNNMCEDNESEIHLILSSVVIII